MLNGKQLWQQMLQDTFYNKSILTYSSISTNHYLIILEVVNLSGLRYDSSQCYTRYSFVNLIANVFAGCR